LVLNLSIGQGEVSLTPIKLAQITSALAADGMLRRPHLLVGVSRDGVPVPHAVPAADTLTQDLGLDQGDLAAIKSAMVAVVNEQGGTGSFARVDSVTVAGKTGTAQNPHGEDHALFICFAPASKPEIVVAVLAENAGHGGSAAAPLAQRVLQAYFHPAAAESAAVASVR